MNHTYASTFISGFGSLVTKQLKTSLKQVTILQNLDGITLYKTNDFHHISSLRFVNNSFIVFESTSHPASQSIEKTIAHLMKANVQNPQAQLLFKKSKSFKVFVSQENQTVSISKDLKQRLVNVISQNTTLSHSPLVADLEFWIFIRSEGFAYFALRLPQKSVKEPEKGELRHELAHLLCLISEPSHQDIVLDPFAGSGAIIRERTRFFPFAKAIASDIHTASMLESNLKDIDNVEIGKYNALYLGKLGSNSIDKIITDPPWGMFNERSKDYHEFYKKMLTEFSWIVKPDGIVIVLTARKDEFISALAEVDTFSLTEEYNILVSGKKAEVYKLIKTSSKVIRGL